MPVSQNSSHLISSCPETCATNALVTGPRDPRMQSGRGQDAELPQSIVVNCGVLDIRVALSQQSGRDSTSLE